MADATVLEFIRKSESDPELGARVRAVNVDDRPQALALLVGIANQAGYELSAPALEAGLAECAPSHALSDAELDAAAGGTQHNQTDLDFVNQRSRKSAFEGFYSLAKS